MNSLIYKSFIIIVLAIIFASAGCKSSSASERGGVKAENLVDIAKLKVGVRVSPNERSPKVIVEYFNGSQSTLWFPVEPTPGYRQDDNSKQILIWFGYFDEVYGLHKGQYILPAMEPLRPGEKLQFELTSPVLARSILESGATTKIRVRVATKAFPKSRVRNDQPFEDYISNSLVFSSDEQ